MSLRSSSGWIGLCSVLRPRQHSIGYMGDGFYRSTDPTNSIKVLKEMLQRKKQRRKTTVADEDRVFQARAATTGKARMPSVEWSVNSVTSVEVS